ncbi:MAG: TadE/TadG family type IV pilus assembly protein, partial [Pseudomonadota bacterium]
MTLGSKRGIRAQWRGLKSKADGFARDESGTAIVFALAVFVIMIIMGGLAVDVVRMEAQRIKMQQTLDRAVLAAADLDNSLDPKAVVNEYFDKSGLGDYMDDSKITVDPLFAGKSVSAEADGRIRTAFLHMVGVPSLLAESAGGAEEQIADIEISLVVDVSGSMSGDRIANLKTASASFFSSVVDNKPGKEGVTSVSVIPYTAHVNVGTTLANRINFDDYHTVSTCSRFRDDSTRDDFSTTAIGPNTWVERNAHFFWDWGYE